MIFIIENFLFSLQWRYYQAKTSSLQTAKMPILVVFNLM